jgi:alpha-tubulin suppressor-like RCC1 family protein
MKKNAFRKMATIVAVASILVAALASRAGAQRIGILLPPGGFTISLPNPNDPIEISAGAFHTCVRKYNNQVYCWGLNGWNLNSGGQVGVVSLSANCTESVVQDPKQISIAPAQKHPCVDRPTFVTSATQIAAGYYHTCALNSGVASCWGSNLFGALGNGDINLKDQSTPQNVMTSTSFTRLASGDSATCGLSSSGVYCWGYLPYDPSVSSSTNIPKQLYSWGGFNGLAVGSRFVCFVYIAGSWGENDCQGMDNLDQLGVVDTSWMPKDGNIPFINTPVLNSTGVGADGWDRVARVSAGPDYVCADVTDGTVQCVGSNAGGKLGSGQSETTWPHRPYTMAVAGSTGAAMQLHGVTTGASHACALDAAGAAWCWGLGRYGEIGNAATGWSNGAPYAVQVAGGRTFRALAAGAQHTCGIGTDNYVYCWGDNEYGQLGIGTGSLGAGVTRIGTPQQIPAF